MNYYIKYLKYKNKYKKLIKIMGGGISSSIIITDEKQDAIKFNKMSLEGKHMQVIYLNKLNNIKSIDNFIISKVVGDGAFGKVYMIIDKKDNKQYVIKVNISTIILAKFILGYVLFRHDYWSTFIIFLLIFVFFINLILFRFK